jgi:SAM-dependent methyltransferase
MSGRDALAEGSESAVSEATQCPLCAANRWVSVREVPFAPIARYWSKLGRRLEEDFGTLPHALEERQCLECGLHFFSPSLIAPAQLYETLARQGWYYNRQKWEFEEALRFISVLQPKHLLEVGCGPGSFLRQARNFAETVQGLEFNEDAVEACRIAGLNVQNVGLDKVTGRFDVIAAFQVLEHLKQPGKVLESWVDRLEAGGHLIVATPNHDGVLGGIPDDCLNLPPHHATLWGEAPLKYVVKRFGVELVRYSREPLTPELYATYSQSLLRRVPARPGLVGKIVTKVSSIIHRGLIPYFFEVASDRLAGHSHVAIYRKSP